MPPLGPVTLPTMYRVRQTFQRTRLEDIPGGVARTLAAAHLPVERGDTVIISAKPVPGNELGEYSREGRWTGEHKTECGLHA